MCQKNPGMASDTEGSSLNYVLMPTKWSKTKVDPTGVLWHEELHLLFGQVGGMYGDQARRRLVANLLLSVPSSLRQALRKFVWWVKDWYPRIMNPMRDTHEEILTNLFQYLNSRRERNLLRDKLDLTFKEARGLHQQLRDASRYIQAAAEVAMPNWLYMYEPWKVRRCTFPGEQLTFTDGPGAQIGPWAKPSRWNVPVQPAPRGGDGYQFIAEARGRDGRLLMRDIVPVRLTSESQRVTVRCGT